MSVYDACYVVLAERLAIPLVTADRSLCRDMDGSGFEVVHIGDVSMPRDG